MGGVGGGDSLYLSPSLSAPSLVLEWVCVVWVLGTGWFVMDVLLCAVCGGSVCRGAVVVCGLVYCFALLPNAV